MSTPAVPRVELAPGYDVARVINGCWQLAAGHGATVDRRVAIDGLLRRVDAGLTTFDCADIYTGVEELLGELARVNRRRGGPELQLHTKLVPDRAELPRLGRAAVERAVDRSLHRLRVERLDLVQMHWWDYDVPGWLELARWLDELRRAGKIRLLGATNFDLPHLRAIVDDAGIPLATHQVQYSLLDRRPEGAMTRFCRERGVALLVYGTLAGGFLAERWLGATDPGVPEPGAPEPGAATANRSLVKYRLIIDETGGWTRFQELLATLEDVAGGHGVTLANVALRWVLERPGVASAIVGARGDRHLESTLATFSATLDDDDRERLATCLARLEPLAGEVYDLERRPGGRHAAIMKTDLNRGADPC